MPPFQPCANCRHKSSNWCTQCDRNFALSVTPLDLTPAAPRAAPQDLMMSVQAVRDIAGLGYNDDSFATPLNFTIPNAPQHPQASRPQQRPAYVAATAPAVTAPYGHQSFQSRPQQNAPPPRAAPFQQMPPASQSLVFHAIYFPKDEESARLVQVACTPPADPSVSMCPVPMVAPYLRTSASYPPVHVMLTERSRAALHSPLQIWCCSGGATTVNRAIWRLTSGRAAWKGDVLVMKFISRRLEGYTNATLGDLPDLAQFFGMAQK